MDGGRSTSKVGPRRGILPNIYMPDPLKERSSGALRQEHISPSSDYNKNKLPSLEVDVRESSKISLLETRVKSVEEANYFLREEVAQLQNDLKEVGTQAINYQDQSNSWLAIMDSIKESNDMISKVVSRLKETEEKFYTEKLSVNALFNRTNQLDRIVTGHQEDMKRQKNHLEYRISEVQTIVRDIQDQRDQTEQLISHLLNDLGQEKNKTDLQDSEIKLIKEEMKKLSKRMTDDSKFASLQKQNEFQSYAEQSCMHIKTTFEQRLLQIEDAFSYIKSKLTVLESEGRILEQRTNVRLSELASTITRQVQKREEDLQKLHQIQVENNHSVESEHVHLQGKIGQLVDSLSNKLFQKEIEFREEVHMKFLDLEKNLHRLQTMRSEHEKACWEECEKKRIALQQLNVEEIKAVSGQQPGSKVQEDFTKMDDDLKKLACSLANKMNWIEKVLKSEIHERDKQETQLENKMDDLHERVSLALVTLQEALGALQEDFINEMKKAATIQQKNAESNAKMKKEFHDRVWDIEQLRRIMGTLWADIHRTKEDSPGEIEKIKENLIDCSAKIKSLRDDLIKLKTEEKLEQENDTPTDSQLFVKEPDTTENKAINRWSVPQAMRRMPWRDKLKSLSAKSVFKRDEPQDKPHDEPRDKPRDEPRDKPRDEPQDKPRDEPQDEPRDKPRDEPRDKPRDEPPPDKKDDAA